MKQNALARPIVNKLATNRKRLICLKLVTTDLHKALLNCSVALNKLLAHFKVQNYDLVSKNVRMRRLLLAQYQIISALGYR